MDNTLEIDTDSPNAEADHTSVDAGDVQLSSDEGSVAVLLRRRSEIESQLSHHRASQGQVVAAGILVVAVILMADVFGIGYWYVILHKGEMLRLFFKQILPNGDKSQIEILAAFTNIAVAGLFILVVAGLIYHFRYRRRLKSLMDENAQVEEGLYELQVRTPEGWRTYLQAELRRLTYLSSKQFINNPSRSRQLKRLAREAEEYLSQDTPSALIDAEFQINAIKKLVLAEEQEQVDQAAWRKLAIAIMVVYISLVLASLVFRSTRVSLSDLGEGQVYIFGIPPLIVVWAAIGSLAAILYRFYTRDAPMRYDIEVRWLIARPIIGIIMGLLAYLALEAGLLLLTSDSDTGSAMRPEIALVVAFLGGFSDKFYVTIIDLLLYRTTGEDRPSADDSAEK